MSVNVVALAAVKVDIVHLEYVEPLITLRFQTSNPSSPEVAADQFTFTLDAEIVLPVKLVAAVRLIGA